jgi:hypothetical protein
VRDRETGRGRFVDECFVFGNQSRDAVVEFGEPGRAIRGREAPLGLRAPHD